MSKIITHEKLSDTLSLAECNDGFWLYDETRGMNLSMRAKTKNAAFLEALQYYQTRLIEIERCYNSLRAIVDNFVSNFTQEESETTQ